MATQITVEFNDQVPIGVEVEETAVDEEIEEVEEAGIKTANEKSEYKNKNKKRIQKESKKGKRRRMKRGRG